MFNRLYQILQNCNDDFGANDAFVVVLVVIPETFISRAPVCATPFEGPGAAIDVGMIVPQNQSHLADFRNIENNGFHQTSHTAQAKLEITQSLLEMLEYRTQHKTKYISFSTRRYRTKPSYWTYQSNRTRKSNKYEHHLRISGEVGQS